MTTPRVLFWHRRDLRLTDNLGLVAAAEISPAVTGVYVLDPAVINPPQELPPMAPARLWFLIESLIELQQRWRDAGSRLLVVEGDPVQLPPQLAPQLPPQLVPTNESERHLSEPIKPTELPAAPQSAPGLSRGCSPQLRTFNPESGRQQI